MRAPIVPFFIPQLGCPGECVYCDQRSVTGHHGPLPTAGDIFSTITAYRETAKSDIVDVAFFGGSFTNLPIDLQSRLLDPVQLLIAEGKVGAVRVSARPDAMGMNAAGFLKEKSVSIVELGVQSMSDEVLMRAGRGHSSACVVDAVGCLRKYGLSVGVQLMPGLPGDTEELSLETMERVLAMQPDFLRIYPTLVLAGTELAKHYKNGSYIPMQLDQAVTLCKKLLHAALRKGVPVIRIGLQPTTELSSAGAVLAGPFHPAFRQLVEGELFLDLISTLGKGFPADADVTIASAPERVADLVGQRRRNIRELMKQRIRVKEICGDPSLNGRQVRLTVLGETRTGDILHDLSYHAKGVSHVS